MTNVIKNKKFLSALFAGALALGAAVQPVVAQDNLINKIKNNQSANSAGSFRFTPIINIDATSVKNQRSAGTCWSFSGNSFLESEMIKAGRQPVALSPYFSARNAYVNKGINYVRMHGAVSLGDGGEHHDVLNMYRKYGAMPYEAYTGRDFGTPGNTSASFGQITGDYLKNVVGTDDKNNAHSNWMATYTHMVDSLLGPVPANFTYKGKTYTPKTFAQQVVGLNPDNYIELSSFTDHPYYEKFVLMVPDNWDFQQVYNVKLNDLTATIDNALKKGYTVGWATDVSERFFSWKNGVAYVPQKNMKDMTDEERRNMFVGPKPELEVTPEIRQRAFDNYETTDDHGMHIVGLAKDQNGKEYYIVKNSWGTTNTYQGYIYVTKNYVRYKTTAIMLNKNALAPTMRSLLKV